MSSTTIRWGLIGASDIAQTRMIPAFRRVGGEVLGVVSSDARHAAAYARRNSIDVGTDNLHDLLALDVDAVYISSLNDKHHAQTIAALESGKHVLCEKPLALNVQDAREMIELADERGLILATNHHLPGSPLHAAVREIVASGQIGTVLSARIVHAVMLPERLQGWRITSEAPGSGVTMDITSHDASVLNQLLGDPVRVTAIEVQQGGWKSLAKDAVMTVIEYAGTTGEPIIAQTHDAFTVNYDTTSLMVQGTAGSIEVVDAMTQETDGDVWLTTAQGRVEVPVDSSKDLYDIVVEAFVASIRGEGRPTATGLDGLLAMQVALAAEESSNSGRSILIEEMR